jgi:hypothetical protein
MKNVILDKTLRDVWYNSHVHKGTKGYYAYGSKNYKCIKTPKGFKYRGGYLPIDTPVYSHGYMTSEFLSIPHGPYVYKCQIPGLDLVHPPSVEEELFPYSSKFLRRSTKYKLKVRCGTHYRVIMIKHDVTTPFCYVFGTNIKLPTPKVPKWMRRNSIVFPHPRKTSKKQIKAREGKVYPIGSPVIGKVYISGVEMRCVRIDQLCKIMYGGQHYYAHASVVFKYES